MPRRPETLLMIFAMIVICALFVSFFVSDILRMNESRDQEDLAAEYLEELDAVDAVHATEIGELDQDIIAPLVWTTDRDEISDIVTSFDKDDMGLAIIVAPESAVLGRNAASEECWFIGKGGAAAEGASEVLASAARVQPEEGTFLSRDNWCQEHGIWE